ncbi:hypothetical protein [Campylobacter gracilis]|uniref:Uncharacterized protein n=1 Tax=Campylobacter gracilis RM3268 TaxID=553220 RepID=C8PLP7_9BACT|nr:hypothetical protein [Campylobacter gracilis]AKT92959.1 hypothetical protein CGRAC_1524 [Campylobacter gracilis]EEV16359.1 hypothetical protein CAMGR0001_2057 [Campylobacter gracilis RM3268]UEB44874.1 hypothetical protein LK410_07635 [Campylobacter gracilis]SUW78715.1 Uncharacterised protein [Campylobacter gracilis]
MQAVKILKILWKVIKIAMLVIAILFFLLIAYIYLAIQISPLSKFPYVKDRDLAKFEALTNTKGETLLIYRKKAIPYHCRDKLQTCICYAHFIKADKPFILTQQKMLQEGYEFVSKSDCIAETTNLHEFKLSWAMPSYHYAGSREYLIYGSIKNLNITAIVNDKRRIWYKKEHEWGQPIDYDHEVIFYPELNIVQINTLGYYSVR